MLPYLHSSLLRPRSQPVSQSVSLFVVLTLFLSLALHFAHFTLFKSNFWEIAKVGIDESIFVVGVGVLRFAVTDGFSLVSLRSSIGERREREEEKA